MKRTNNQRTKPATNRSTSKKKSSLGGLMVVVIILGLIVAVLFLKEPFKNLDLSWLNTKPVSETPNNLTTPDNSNQKPVLPQVLPEATPSTDSPPAQPETPKSTPESPVVDKPKTLLVDGNKANPTSIDSPKTTPKPVPNSTPKVVNTPTPETSTTELKKATLFWAKVSDDGVIHLEKSIRSIAMGDSPLSSTIRALLRGPSADDLNAGNLSLIPPGSQLLSAYIQNGVAFLNFSEEFQFNPMGNEGAKTQLRQIVWAATEFSTVTSVQILIDGKRLQFLGGDGIAIGKALTRSSF